MTNTTTTELKSQLSAEFQKKKKPRDYDRIKSLHADIRAANEKARADVQSIVITVPLTSEQNQEIQKKARARVDRRRVKKGIVMERSTYVPKWKKNK